MSAATAADTPTPAQVYEAKFVPALFHQWGAVTADAAAIRAGQRVLDVACGTGVLAGAAAERVGNTGSVTGVDANEDMLAVARAKNPRIGWRLGRAESLPFDDGTFDAVVSQFGLMFFDDRAAALREMMRVLRPEGRLAVTVCDALEHSPGYSVLAELLQRLFGQAVAAAFRAPFQLGDRKQLLALCAQAGIDDARVDRHEGRVRFSSVDALVSTERACVWTLGGMLNANQFESLRTQAESALRPFVMTDGRVEFSMPALLIKASKPR